MKLLRTVNRHPYKPIIIAQKAAPVIVKQCGICLQAIYYLTSTAILLLKFDDTLIERQRTDGGLAAMPCETHLRSGLRLDILLDILLQGSLTHELTRIGLPEHLPFFKIIAILARQIASRADRLGHNIHNTRKRILKHNLIHISSQFLPLILTKLINLYLSGKYYPTPPCQ